MSYYERLLSKFAVPMNIFDHYNSVIDDESNGDHHSEKSEEINGETHQPNKK